MRRNFKRLLAAAGLALSAVFLWLALRDLEPDSLWQALRRANPLWFLPFLLSVATFCWLKAVRWSILLQPACSAPASSLVPPVVIGYTGTALMPLQLGEVVRAYLTAASLGARLAAVLASLVVERLLDVFMLFFIVALAVLLGTDVAASYRSVGLLFALIAALTCAALWVYASHTERFIAVVQRATAFLPAALRERILEQLRVGAAGALALRQPTRYLALGLLSLLQWSCMWACTWISLAAIGEFTSPAAALTVLATTMVSMTLPSAPGYVGTLQLAYVLALAPFGVERGDALAASLIYLAGLWFPLVITGLLMLHRTGTQLSAFTRPPEIEAS